ncbi:MAG: PKD domain-containing protein [Bacteroidetes bacterium]|nr:PKD domain-containing protein [Bacteroidota bacterium]
MNRYFLILIVALTVGYIGPTQSQTTITLQPGPEDGKDAFISTYYPDQNYYYHIDYIAMAWTAGGIPFVVRSLIEFDLSVVPSGASIINASLSLYNSPDPTNNHGEHSSLSGPNTCWLQRITDEWDEYTVTWNNQPSTTTLHQVTLKQSVDPHQDYEDIDVTQLIKDIIDNPETGHGFMIRLITEEYYRCMIFASSDHPDPNLHPKLAITFIAPVADFLYILENKTVYFNNLSQWADTFLWNFGDGVQSILENPVHEYQDFGDYEVTLIASKEEMSDTVTKVVRVCLQPVAEFDYQLDEFTLSVSNTSQNALSYFWDFGDGSFSYMENPTHVYPDAGEYELRLVAYNDCEPDTAVEYITVYHHYEIDFDYTCGDLRVSFVMNTSSDYDSFIWDFGDGIQSILENPVHIYQDFGEYEVTVKASNELQSDTVVKMIKVCQRPDAEFGYQLDGYTLSVNNLSQNANSYLWDFGDGNISFLENPTYEYLVEGDYEVSLIAFNECAPDTAVENISICKSPVAGFDYICEDFRVSFMNTTINYDSCIWDYGDGIGSTLINPEHIYQEPGDYSVNLAIWRFCGENLLTQELVQVITVPCSPQASFTYAISEFEISFTNMSFNATSFIWDFGDGDTSDIQNPVHSYAEIGDYQVQLIAYNDHGSDTIVELINITSIDQILKNNIISIFPNPAHGRIYLKIDFGDFSSLNYQLLNMQGQIIREDKLYPADNGCLNPMDISYLKGGIYYFRFFNQEISMTKKVVIY